MTFALILFLRNQSNHFNQVHLCTPKYMVTMNFCQLSFLRIGLMMLFKGVRNLNLTSMNFFKIKYNWMMLGTSVMTRLCVLKENIKEICIELCIHIRRDMLSGRYMIYCSHSCCWYDETLSENSRVRMDMQWSGKLTLGLYAVNILALAFPDSVRFNTTPY